MAVQVQPRPDAIDPDGLEVLRAKAFAAWGRGATATYDAWFEDAFQEGWIRLEKTLASGREVTNWQGYIVESGRNYLHRLHSKGGRTTALPGDEATMVDPGAAERFEAVVDHAERLHHVKLVRQVLAEEFDERERQLIKLRYELQRDDREIAEVMNVSPRAVKRLFSGKREKGQPGINQRLARYIGSPPDEALLCRSRRSQVKALVGGWKMSNTRKAQVQAHLQTCEGCRTFTRRALGYRMLLPPIALPSALAAHSSIAGAAADGGGSAALAGPGGGGNAAETAGALKRHLADALASGKQQAVALHARITGVDPSALPALRPGAVAGAVAGCIALGSGATYCATQGIPDPLRAPLGIAQPEQPPETQEVQTKPPATPPQPPATPATPLPERPPQPEPTPKPAASASPPRSATPVQIQERNFGIEPQPQAPTPSSAPAPASGGGGVAQKEFGVP